MTSATSVSPFGKLGDSVADLLLSLFWNIVNVHIQVDMSFYQYFLNYSPPWCYEIIGSYQSRTVVARFAVIVHSPLQRSA